MSKGKELGRPPDAPDKLCSILLYDDHFAANTEGCSTGFCDCEFK